MKTIEKTDGTDFWDADNATTLYRTTRIVVEGKIISGYEVFGYFNRPIGEMWLAEDAEEGTRYEVNGYQYETEGEANEHLTRMFWEGFAEQPEAIAELKADGIMRNEAFSCWVDTLRTKGMVCEDAYKRAGLDE